MNNLRFQIEKIFKGSAKSFHRFPSAIISAIVISITAIIKITMDWEVQQTYEFLFTSIQMSFLLGAVFSMAIVTLGEVKANKSKSFYLLENLSGIILAIISFLLLYFYGGIIGEDKISYLSSIAMARVNVGVFISLVAFIYIISKAKSVDSFSDSFFITHRAFIISALYGLVIMLGVSGVLGAFQSLVYREMDYRVYQYLGVVVGFLTYTIFLGYFPSFIEMENKEEVNNIKDQPRFIFVLFENILVPIMMALTIVLLIWSVRVIFQGMDVSFNQLSGIASSYIIIGIWLHIMVSKHNTKISEFYKRVYPFAGILILIFEAWALIVQLKKFGLKTAEYSFLMIWIFAIISIILLILLKNKSYRKIAITAVVVSIVWILPIVGYEDITFNSQVNRLEKTLIAEELLINNEIIATDEDIEYIKRGEITDGVDFISYSEKENIPMWFKKDLNDEKIFKDTFGFEKVYGLYPEPSEFNFTNFRLKADLIDISDYALSLTILPNEKLTTFNEFEGEAGDYEIMISNESLKAPKITIKLEGNIIAEEDMSKYLLDLQNKHSSQGNREIQLPFEDMHFIVEAGDISILLIFSNINVYFDERRDGTEYYIQFHGIFVKEDGIS